MAVKLGDQVRDRVTGFVGIATCRSDFLNGCTRIGVQAPVDKEGKVPDACWFDEPQLDVLDVGVVPRGPVDTGGPMPSIPTRNAVERR